MNSALALLLAALAAGPTQKVAFLGLEPLGVDLSRAQRVDAAARRALARVPELAVSAPADVKRVLGAEPSLGGCTETQCLARLASLLGVDAVITGVVGGLGGFQSLVLKRTDREGRVVTSVSEDLGGDDSRIPGLVCTVLGRLPECWNAVPLIAPPPPPVASAAAPSGLGARRVVGIGVSAAALATLASGLGFGLSSQSIAGAIEKQQTGCAGAGAAACLEGRFAEGRMHATVANVCWGLGAALAVTGVVLIALPTGGSVTVGPGPTPAGLSAHVSFH